MLFLVEICFRQRTCRSVFIHCSFHINHIRFAESDEDGGKKKKAYANLFTNRTFCFTLSIAIEKVKYKLLNTVTSFLFLGVF